MRLLGRGALCLFAGSIMAVVACGRSTYTPPPPSGVCWNQFCRALHFSLGEDDYGHVIHFKVQNESSEPVVIPQGHVVVVAQRKEANGSCTVVATLAQPMAQHTLNSGSKDVYTFDWSSHPNDEIWTSVFITGDGSQLPLPDASQGSFPYGAQIPHPPTPCVPPPASALPSGGSGT